jgi:hypothetical protein
MPPLEHTHHEKSVIPNAKGVGMSFAYAGLAVETRLGLVRKRYEGREARYAKQL